MSDDSDGTTRRQVLAGAAGAATLPAWANVSSDVASAEEAPDDGDDPEYGTTTLLKTTGTLEVWTESNNKTEVQVGTHPEGIGLRLKNEIGAMNVLLLPEDIEPLCRELLDARAKTNPEDVEDARDWITKDFREGDE